MGPICTAPLHMHAYTVADTAKSSWRMWVNRSAGHSLPHGCRQARQAGEDIRALQSQVQQAQEQSAAAQAAAEKRAQQQQARIASLEEVWSPLPHGEVASQSGCAANDPRERRRRISMRGCQMLTHHASAC